MRLSAWVTWGVVLGFALGGFFDGILLHQILQWHHLLSEVPGLVDLRTQVLWDGYFHALMYLVAAAGLWGLWRTHRKPDGAGDRGLAGALLVGFGLWHVVDGVLSHWILAIHRIRPDSEFPLAWDLGWFLGFGVVPLVCGWLFMRHRNTPSLPASALVLLALTTATAAAGAWSLRPPDGQRFSTVAFRPDLEPGQVLAALAAVDARLVWSDPTMGVVVVDVAFGRQWDLFGRGALLVSGTAVPAGCFGWTAT